MDPVQGHNQDNHVDSKFDADIHTGLNWRQGWSQSNKAGLSRQGELQVKDSGPVLQHFLFLINCSETLRHSH